MDIFGSNLTQKGRNPVTPATVRAYSYTRYDKIGRIIEVGEVLTDQKVATYKNESQVQYASHEAFVGAAAAYKHQRSLTTYDRNETPPQGFAPTYLRNRVAYTTYQQTPNSAVQATHYSYDVHGNVNSLLQVITHDGNVLAKTVDYEYDLISGKVNKVYYQKAKTDQLIHQYAYDGDNRITEVKTSTDDVLYTKEATYQYYAHGPLARTTTGELNVETQNYAYTVQGWIKQMQAEAFSYALGYNEKDYTSIGATASILSTPISRTSDNKSKGLYNGNIASMTSNTPRMTEVEDQPPILQQQYSYDQLNRITASNTPGAIEANAYKTSYSYDANGNIQTLVRYDGRGAKFDELAYNYENKAKGYLKNTNKLRWVDDIPELTAVKKDVDVDDQSTDNYSYDAIGNLIADDQEQIANIEWTVSGKVKRVTRTINSSKPDLEFEYDASGQRIVKKVIKKDGEISSTYYLRDASGNVMSVYVYNSLKDNTPLLSEQYLYGSSRIGVYTPGANVLSKTRSFGRKSYELSDHLGNVRATLSDYRRLASPQIVQSATDYYPFGMVARSVVSNNGYRYGFNGKEHEDDITGGDYDFGARIYDPRLGRWLAVDPLTLNYAWASSYCFASNTPIQAIDPDGEKVYFVIMTGGEAEYAGAALTRVREIQSSPTYDPEKDFVYYIDLEKDSRLLSTIIEEKVNHANKNNYGLTVELSTYGHGGSDGPVMGTQHTGKDDLSKHQGRPLDAGQLTPDGWAAINFNFDRENSIAVFYGCKTEEFAQRFLIMQNVKYSAGLSSGAGVSEDNEKYDPNFYYWEGEDLWLWDGYDITVYTKGPGYKVSYYTETGKGRETDISFETPYTTMEGNVTEVGTAKPSVDVDKAKSLEKNAKAAKKN